MHRDYFSVLILATLASVASAEEVAFKRHVINPRSEFPACAAIDVNHDGKLDIVSGGYWYEAPTWKLHKLRDVEMIRGRYDDYSNLPLDVNGDGHLDVISVNYRSKSIYWRKNPGDPTKLWTKHVADVPGSSETGRLADVDADGDLDVLPNGTKFAAWYEIDRDATTVDDVKWIKHELPAEVIGHGLGFGDVNGDGRNDLISPKGWLLAPEDRKNGRWVWQPEFRLHRDCAIPIIVHDVDGDGDNDLIWSRGHNIGIYWLEQTKADNQRSWRFHVVDTSWSGCHSLMLADIDGNGSEDLVGGKRYMGHDGKDPGEYDPLAIYWYEFDRSKRTWRRHVISEGFDCGFDTDPKCVDIDSDGDIDILAGARSGLFLLENLGRQADTRSSPELDGRIELTKYHDESGRIADIETPWHWGIRRSSILRKMELVMGPLPGSHDRVPLDVEIIGEEKTDKYTKRKITYRADDIDRVPAYVLIPHSLKKPAPAMLCLHSTRTSGKDSVCGEIPELAYAHELAKRGYVCLVPDYPSLGEYEFDFEKHIDRYPSGSMKAIWNNIRGIDLLESMPEVNRDRIGAIGHSLGGHNSLFSAVFDQRIRAVVTSCGFNAFEDYARGDLTGWSGPRYMPRVRERYRSDPKQMPFNFDEVLAAIAPRPVLVSAPTGDDNFPIVGVKKSVKSAARIYEFRKKRDALRIVHPETGHSFTEEVRQQAYLWLDDRVR